MSTLITIYWLCFGFGLVYLLVAGTLGAISGGLDTEHGDLDIDHDHDFDFDADVDTDGDFCADAGHSIDLDFDTGIDIDGHAEIGDHADVTADYGAETADAGDHGHDAGHIVGGVADFPGFSLFSPLAIAGFLMAFGGAGLLSVANKLSLLAGVAIALGGGAAMSMFLWLVIGKFLYGMQGSSEARQSDMVGLEAEVLTPMEDDISGEIAYILSGVRYTAPARLSNEGHADKREKVRIRGMRDNIVYVEKKKQLLS